MPRNLTCLSVFREIPGMSFACCTAVSLCQKSFLPASLGSHRAFLARLPWLEWLFLGTAHISFNSAVPLICSPQPRLVSLSTESPRFAKFQLDA